MSAPIFEFRAATERGPVRWLYRTIGKRLIDIAFVLVLLPAVLPLMATILAFTWLQGGAPLYSQPRVGRNGREFRCWKVRTMVRDADARLAALLLADPGIAAEWHRNQKLARDPRITPFGAVLRRTSLDELPQLWNVLVGEMSLVGPRPFTPEQRALYFFGRADAPYYQMRPGITGLWQTSRRNAGSFIERVVYDGRYWQEMGLTADLAILVRTVGVVVRATGN